jgi:hypothetical protein
MDFGYKILITMSKTMTSDPYNRNTEAPVENDWDISSEDFDLLAKEKKLEYLKIVYSPTSSGYCYNGITRHPYPFKKNHPDAKKLFAVHDSHGTFGRKDPYKIYYDTPEQYERHRRVRLHSNVIDAFYTRQRQLSDSNIEES